jgi:hypothetical protein
MPEIGTSSSMSGDGKRSVGHRPQATAPVLDSTISEATVPGHDGSYLRSCGRHRSPAATTRNLIFRWPR